MKFHALTLAVATSAVVLTGCQYPNGETNNTGSGALIGAGTGALIGGANGRGGGGALIGAAIGAVAGTIIGSSMDEEQRERLRAQAPQTYVRVEQGQPLATADVKALAQAGVNDDIIIAQIRNSHTIYHLSAADIIDLHNAGVSDRVVNFMINTATSSAATTTTVVETAPPPSQTEVYVTAPGPGYVWIGGEWIWNGGWYWHSGYWAYPPYSGGIWIGGTWSRGSRGWYHSPGHWRR
ncbi:MAG TPA: YXWGXW repeat-containing protein [Methylomirabilota bacterium]|nr:YXWGXW repeat-containing protein [Methylomirabilota bacterium]